MGWASIAAACGESIRVVLAIGCDRSGCRVKAFLNFCF
jgi:hypothetical protein